MAIWRVMPFTCAVVRWPHTTKQTRQTSAARLTRGRFSGWFAWFVDTAPRLSPFFPALAPLPTAPALPLICAPPLSPPPRRCFPSLLWLLDRKDSDEPPPEDALRRGTARVGGVGYSVAVYHVVWCVILCGRLR